MFSTLIAFSFTGIYFTKDTLISIYIFCGSMFVLVTIYFIDLVILINVFRKLNAKIAADNSCFEGEKNRFWMLIQVFFIMSVIVPFKFYCTVLIANYESKMVSDVIVLFTTVLFLAIFGMKKNTKGEVSSRYQLSGNVTDL